METGFEHGLNNLYKSINQTQTTRFGCCRFLFNNLFDPFCGHLVVVGWGCFQSLAGSFHLHVHFWWVPNCGHNLSTSDPTADLRSDGLPFRWSQPCGGVKIQIQHPDIQQAISKSIKIQQVNNPEVLMIWIWIQQIAWSGNFFHIPRWSPWRNRAK